MAQFSYLGDHAETEVFDLLFRAGEPVEVTDETAIFKLRNNPHFSEVVDGVELMPDTPKRKPGRPRKEA